MSRHTRLWSSLGLLCLVSIAPLALAQSSLPSDAIVLTVTKGPGAGEIQLAWSGGPAVYGVFRATTPFSVLDPVNLEGQVLGNLWTETPPADPILFYVISNPPCASGSDCASGFCVDGACCDTACVGTCQACNLSASVGTCASIPPGQDPADECIGVTACNGAGACTLLSNGQACAVNSECQSGACTDGVCCDALCTGVCKACNVAGSIGTCSNVPSGQDPANECAGTTTCNGAGMCLLANGATCTVSPECQSAACVDGVCCNNTCTGTCRACNLTGSVGTCSNILFGQDPANECVGVTACNGAGACALLNIGSSCSVNAECQSGACVDSVCCSSTCTGLCRACNIPGSLGNCTNVPPGQDPANECAGASTCTGAGTCSP